MLEFTCAFPSPIRYYSTQTVRGNMIPRYSLLGLVRGRSKKRLQVRKMVAFDRFNGRRFNEPSDALIIDHQIVVAFYYKNYPCGLNGTHHTRFHRWLAVACCLRDPWWRRSNPQNCNKTWSEPIGNLREIYIILPIFVAKDRDCYSSFFSLSNTIEISLVIQEPPLAAKLLCEIWRQIDNILSSYRLKDRRQILARLVRRHSRLELVQESAIPSMLLSRNHGNLHLIVNKAGIHRIWSERCRLVCSKPWRGASQDSLKKLTDHTLLSSLLLFFLSRTILGRPVIIVPTHTSQFQIALNFGEQHIREMAFKFTRDKLSLAGFNEEKWLQYVILWCISDWARRGLPTSFRSKKNCRQHKRKAIWHMVSNVRYDVAFFL
jgi:hypothetical protein